MCIQPNIMAFLYFFPDDKNKSVQGGSLQHCSTNSVNIDKELRWSVALLLSNSGCHVTGSLYISPENRMHPVSADLLRMVHMLPEMFLIELDVGTSVLTYHSLLQRTEVTQE